MNLRPPFLCNASACCTSQTTGRKRVCASSFTCAWSRGPAVRPH